MGAARALISAAALVALTGSGRHLLEVFTPGQVLRIGIRGFDQSDPPLPPAVNVRVVEQCENGVYGKRQTSHLPFRTAQTAIECMH